MREFSKLVNAVFFFSVYISVHTGIEKIDLAGTWHTPASNLQPNTMINSALII